MFNLNNQTRELTDSLKQTLPAFKTKQGRLVYGGGGITPDIFNKDTTTVSKSTLEIVFDSKRPLFNYAENIKHKYIKITISGIPRVNTRGNPKTPNHFGPFGKLTKNTTNFPAAFGGQKGAKQGDTGRETLGIPLIVFLKRRVGTLPRL